MKLKLIELVEAAQEAMKTANPVSVDSSTGEIREHGSKFRVLQNVRQKSNNVIWEVRGYFARTNTYYLVNEDDTKWITLAESELEESA